MRLHVGMLNQLGQVLLAHTWRQPVCGVYVQAHRVVVGKGEGAEVATQASGLRGLGWGASSSRETLGTGGATQASTEGGFLVLELWMGIPEWVVDWGSLWNQLRRPNLEES